MAEPSDDMPWRRGRFGITHLEENVGNDWDRLEVQLAAANLAAATILRCVKQLPARSCVQKCALDPYQSDTAPNTGRPRLIER